MPRLVNADELIKMIPTEEYNARMAITYAPTVDAVEVVRCKDCKYAWMTYDGECKYCDMWEEEGEMYLDGNFYCAFGKRKEDETND